MVRFGQATTRVVGARPPARTAIHELSVGFAPGEPKRMRVDGAAVERLLDVAERPLVSVFLPDRLELIKGAPSLRRAHLDQFVAALWPARAATRRAYAQTLAQRNALIARIRHGGGRPRLAGQLGRAAGRARDRADGRPPGRGRGDRRGLRRLLRRARARRRPRSALPAASRATDAEQLRAELAERVASDLDRGFTGHGPHRDDLVATRGGARAARLRLTGPAAAGAAGAAAGRAGRAGAAPPDRRP